MERSDYLVLVNKDHKLPDGWEQKAELVEIKNGFGKMIKIEKETLEKFNQLKEDLLNDGVDIELDSVYRSLPIQKDLFEEYKEKY
jgi:D-alanyl-D-alanine carboxypeptidase